MNWPVLILLFSYPILQVLAIPSVIELSDADFENHTAKYPSLLVLFYKPRCQYCQYLMPVYDQISVNILHNNEMDVRLSQINCDENQETCTIYDITSYPTLKMFKRGDDYATFKGQNTKEDILDFIMIGTRAAYEVLSNIKDFENLTHHDDAVMIGFFSPQSVSSFRMAFERLADLLKLDYKIGLVSDPAVSHFDEDHVRVYRPLALRNPYEPDYSKVADEPSSRALYEFFTAAKHGLVGIRHAGNIQEFQNCDFVMYCPLDFQFNVKQTQYYRNRVLALAQRHKDFRFAMTDVASVHQEVPDLKPRDMQAYFVYMPAGVTLYSEFETPAAEGFVRKVRAALDANNRDAEFGAMANSANVPEVTTETFTDLVDNAKNDVLLAVLSRKLCSVCDKVLIALEELKYILTNDAVDILVYYYDKKANNNAPESLKAAKERIPTLLWRSRNGGFEEYDDDWGWTANMMVKFVATRILKPLQKFKRNGEPKGDSIIKDEL